MKLVKIQHLKKDMEVEAVQEESDRCWGRAERLR